jgi:cytochrome c
MRISQTVVVIAAASAAIAGGRRDAARVDPRTLPGWQTYDRYCLPCHGANGDGQGPAAPFTWGRPRGFSRGDYEWRSTPIGQPPSDDDLRAAIRYGAPGTSMPAFGDVLDAEAIDRAIDVVKAFAPASFAAKGVPVKLAREPAIDAERGAKLWTQVGCDRCHGARGNGDGPGAKSLAEPPYDLEREPLRRPRSSDDPIARRRAAALSIATGMAGTGMPGYAGQLPDADVWALADHVVALGARATRRDRSALDADEIAADAKAKVATGTWPGHGDDDARVFGGPIAAQGPPPASLAPAEASLRARQCARCHAKQFREWQPTLHAQATAAGFPARVHGLDDPASCARCHAPLAEQADDGELRTEGVTCAGCHVREWVRRGPPNLAPSLARVAGYPLVELALYERGDFCLPCHQLPPRTAVAGKPLLNTYKEWLEGPYMRRGIQCQSCHMPNREHAWLGVHDRETFRQGIRLDASAHRKDGAVTVLAELRNVGAGHYLPTTATPSAWLRVELYDARGVAIAGARAELRIGRDVLYDAQGWHERADTRIPPGESVTLARAWSGGRTAEAAIARVTVEVHPDDYYEQLYAHELAGKLAPDARLLYERAAARARASHYIAEQRDVALSSKQ